MNRKRQWQPWISQILSSFKTNWLKWEITEPFHAVTTTVRMDVQEVITATLFTQLAMKVSLAKYIKHFTFSAWAS